MKELSRMTPGQLVGAAIAASLLGREKDVLAIEAELKSRVIAKATAAPEPAEYFTMESKYATMKLLQKVMS